VGSRFVAVAAVLSLAGVCSVSVARADNVPAADLAVVSQTANVRQAKVGDEVTFTVVTVNNGPDAAELDVVDNPADFQLVDEQCDFGVSPDTPACEYGSNLFTVGQLVTTVMVTKLTPVAGKFASNTVCVSSEDAILDPNPGNNCLMTSVRVVGKRLK
jgi:predicted lipoprotein